MVFRDTISVMVSASGDDIDAIHKGLTEQIVKNGRNFKFGGHEEVKKAREVFATIQFFGRAIIDLKSGKAPEGFSWGGLQKIKEFQQLAIAEDTNQHGHDYTYQQLLRGWKGVLQGGYEIEFNQLEAIRRGIRDEIEAEIESNRHVAVLYDPVKMKDMVSKPCWNWLQVRYMGRNRISVRVLFRSHDYGTGLWANASFVLFMLDHFIAKKLKCHISEFIIVSASGHIYDSEADAAEDVSGYDWATRKDKAIVEFAREYMAYPKLYK
jgi:thymidylate synthase